MTGYSTREVSEVLGLPASTILSWTRAGLLTPVRGPRGGYCFSFQDIALLRGARELLASDVTPRRVRRALETLREQLPAGRPLSAVTLTSLGGQVLISDAGAVWEPASGQLLIGLDRSASESDPPLEAAAADTVVPGAPAGPSTADGWYETALDLERGTPRLAVEAYRRALALDPAHPEAHLNLGRLLHEEGDLDGAEGHYRAAVRADPSSARALFNLGVALEDRGRRAAAAEAYEASLGLEPDLAAAHFNLSRLHEAAGLHSAALAHLAAYKRILDRDTPAG